MSKDKIFIMLVAAVIGFVVGFISRPVMLPIQQDDANVAAPALSTSSEVRGTQYFVAHIDEARQIVAGCRDGSVRGGECATAEEAIIKLDAEERRRRFLGN